MRCLTLLALLLALACTPAPPGNPGPGATRSSQPGAQATATPRSASPTAQARPTSPPRPLASGLKTEVVADGLQLPANLAFAPDGRLFLTEVPVGRVRVVEQGTLLTEPFAQLDPAIPGAEMGLLGLALDPDFSRTHHVFLFHSQVKADKPWRNRVVRLTEVAGRGTEMEVVLENLPIGDLQDGGIHNGGRLAFGQDHTLYVTVGDASKPELAQDMKRLNGKLLRVNVDGSVPNDNPFPGSPIYALGLRNAWGLAIHPLTGAPYVTDNGGKGHDEVNRVLPGAHLGFPRSEGIVRDRRWVDPLWESGLERGGIAGLTFYTGELFRSYRNDLLFCAFGSSQLIRLRLAAPDYDRIEEEELLSRQCNLDVATGPDGAIYFTSVSQVLRLVPEQ